MSASLRVRCAIAALLALSASAVCAPPATAAMALQPLRSVRGAAPAIIDAGGRHVLLRGVNVNQLGDYYQDNPALAPVVPLTESDFAGIAHLGFDSVRLIVHWSALEPAPGAFDAAYVARIHQAVEWARKYDLYVVLDMHQDAWGKYIASAPGEVCPPGFSPAIGWDGAPQWATITDGLSTCRVQLREVSPAVAQAFTNFYADRSAIQTELLHTWARLAAEFAADPTIAGYDLLNEPHPGYTPGPAAAAVLGTYYGNAIDAIRAAEHSVAGGFSHIAFFEPNVTWSGTGADAVPPPSFTSDDNIVFAPHLYAGSITADRALGITAVSVDQGFQVAAAAASTYGTTVWSGEWGWFGDPAKDAPSIADYAREEDANLFGGAWWDWKQACGDPHVVGSPGAKGGTLSPSLNRIRCPEGTLLGIPGSTRQVLSRAYVRAAPGRLDELASDPPTGELTVRGRDDDPAGSCLLDLWIPGDRPGTPRFETTNVRSIAAARVAGGWRVSGCASGSYALRRVASAAEVATGHSGAGRPRSRPRLRVSVSPRRVIAGRRVRFALRVTTSARGVAGAVVRFAGRSARTDRGGRATYYGNAIDAIRAAEHSVAGGFSHIAFFEPNVTWSGTGADAVPPPSFTSDDNIVFAPHLYAGSITADRALGITAVSVDQGFQVAAAAASTYGTTVWSGEWGWFGDPAKDAPSIADYAREEDANLFGGAWWDWKQACGDPHVVGSPGAKGGTLSPSLNRIRCPEGTLLGIPGSTRQVLSRAYVRAAPGRLDELASDPPTGELTVRGRDDDPAGSCLLDLWIPGDRPGTPRFETTNVRSIAAARVAGGWRVSGCASGSYALRRVASAAEVATGHSGAGRPRSRPRLRVSVSPRRVIAGRRVRFALRVTTSARGVAGAVVRFAGRSARTDRGGRATITASLRTRGRWSARARKRGYVTGTASVRALHARRR